ncbi:hypothetical protein SEA_PERIWINKLE_68 [Gordonia phage Periwinkle]|nr:hypothetical protein SEA_PERIWINKLE_68 [Gordonia phage Periwinkle]
MSTALATLSSSDLNPAEALSQLQAVQERIATIDTPEILVEVIDRAKLATQWVQIKNASAEVALQATRVQIAAVRRIGQLGDVAVALLPEPEAKYAARLAQLTDSRFRSALDELERPIKASTFWQKIAALESYAWDLNRGYDIANGIVSSKVTESQAAAAAAHERRQHKAARRKSPSQKARDDQERKDQERRERLRNDERLELMGRLLRQLYSEGDPFSVSEATDKMLDLLGEQQELYAEDHPFHKDPRFCEGDEWVREGVSAAIRHALMSSAVLDDSGREVLRLGSSEVHPPRFITYQDPDAGWVRIPWASASLAQLKEMAELRAQQAAALSQKSADLQLLVKALSNVSTSETDSCPTLLVKCTRGEHRRGRADV